MRRTPGRRKSSDDVINLVWDSFRANNGIMSLLQLLQTKVPATDADAIRALSCQALVGLARSPTATQIMSKLPIFNNGSLTMLVREPVLPDHRDEHLKFQRYAHELLEKVCVFSQCCGSALVSMRIRVRIQFFISVWILILGR